MNRRGKSYYRSSIKRSTSGCVYCEKDARESFARETVVVMFDHTIKHWIESLLRHASRAVDAINEEAVRIVVRLRDREVDRQRRFV